MLMKIEKITENQIRCTLTSEDLASRQLKLSELAYGSEKAKRLFREMMQQASFEFGFEAEDIPLMIEAIPMDSGCVVLLITKVEDPEELDTRFAHFAPSENEMDGEDEEEDEEDMDGEDGDGMPDFLRQMQAARRMAETPAAESTDSTRTFHFRTMSEVMSAALQTGGSSSCTSALYKSGNGSGYYLVVGPDDCAPADFHRLCNTLSEYGVLKRGGSFNPLFLAEHCEVLLAQDALLHLSGR